MEDVEVLQIAEQRLLRYRAEESQSFSLDQVERRLGLEVDVEGELPDAGEAYPRG
jgi:hypothetical protein